MAQVEKLDRDSYRITGALDCQTVTAALTQFHAMDLGPQVTIDLSGLERSNSAGLVLLLELISDAKKQGRKISFTGIPQSLIDLAEMTNVTEFLSA